MSVLDKFSLAGKTALVTGCRRGIGFGIADALAGAGDGGACGVDAGTASVSVGSDGWLCRSGRRSSDRRELYRCG